MSIRSMFVSRRYLPQSLPLLSAIAVLLLMPHLAHASTADTSTGNLPWESALEILRNSFSGPVAYAVSLIGIIVTGSMLVWGGEINEFGRKSIMVVLAVSLIVLANATLSSLFTSAETLSPPTKIIAQGRAASAIANV